MSKNNIKTTVLNKLTESLGVDAEDVSLDDRFSLDLHMSSNDISDFVHSLKTLGYVVDLDEASSLKTVEELVEYISENEGV